MSFNGLEFTIDSFDKFYDTVDADFFKQADAEAIYEHLYQKIHIIPFGDYLKRYIYKLAGLEGDYNEIDLREYQYIIVNSFKERNTPNSFDETSAKLSALSKNWLTRMSVSRKTVFLLGFGLGMDVSDVSYFLVKAQREHDFNFKDPFEVICWYCFKNHYKYSKFVSLTEKYKALETNGGSHENSLTAGVRRRFFDVRNEEELMAELAKIKNENEGKYFSVTSRYWFNKYYDDTRKIIAGKYTEDAENEARFKAREYLEKMSYSDFLSSEEKLLRSEKIRNSFKRYSEEDITESDVEKFLCCGIPFDGQGNLLKSTRSGLAKVLGNKRMSRKHINDILTGKSTVDRFDLITLCFFVFSMNENISDNKVRFYNFVSEINKTLDECNMGQIYVENPYECFLMMCTLCDWPMGAYSDVLEKAFETEA